MSSFMCQEDGGGSLKSPSCGAQIGTESRRRAGGVGEETHACNEAEEKYLALLLSQMHKN